MTVPLKHLSSANGFTAPSLPFLSSSPRPPAHLSIISPLDLHSLSLHLALLFFHTCTFFSDCICPSFLCLFIPLSLLSMFHLLFIFPFVLRFPPLLLQPSNLCFQSHVHYSLSYSPLFHPHKATHTHTLSSYFPAAQAPFDLSKCTHRTPIDLCIQME